jgi:hypothetical protein
MSKALRMRIVALQAIMVVVLAAAGGFAIYEGTFVRNMVHDQLAAQAISFPGQDQIKTGGALDPAKFSQEIRDQAGNQVVTGEQARIYANDFIGVHLNGIAAGLTYSQMSSQASAANATLTSMSKDDPGYADAQKQATTLSNEKTTMFQGDTLRSILLNSYGWDTMGVYAQYAGFGLLLAALVVLSALGFEVFVAGRRKEAGEV